MVASYMVVGAGSFLGVCQKNGVAFPVTRPLVATFPTLHWHGKNVSMQLLLDHRGQ
jgi:hypothetical protein